MLVTQPDQMVFPIRSHANKLIRYLDLTRSLAGNYPELLSMTLETPRSRFSNRNTVLTPPLSSMSSKRFVPMVIGFQKARRS